MTMRSTNDPETRQLLEQEVRRSIPGGKMACLPRTGFTAVVAVALSVIVLRGQQASIGYDDTPMQSDGKWRVHDSKRPRPVVVSPYADGQAAAMYGQFPPLVNASRQPGEWQSYDISFSAPKFNGADLVAPAVVTVFHNGVLVHNARPFWGPTAHRRIDPYVPSTARGPVALRKA
jgi:hypothetical protein